MRTTSAPPTRDVGGPPRPAWRRIAAAATVSAVVMLSTGACSLIRPATVATPIDQSAGVSVELDGVQIRNVVVVSADEHRPGVLSALIHNSNDSVAQVSVSTATGASSNTITVAPGRSVSLGPGPDDRDDESLPSPALGSVEKAPPEPGWLQIPDVPELPGLTLPLTFHVDGQDVVLEGVPVVLPCFQYSSLRPTPPTPPAPPTAAPTANPSASDPEPVVCGSARAPTSSAA